MSRATSPSRSIVTEDRGTMMILDKLDNITSRLERIELTVITLGKENEKRAQEIKDVWTHLKVDVTDDDAPAPPSAPPVTPFRSRERQRSRSRSSSPVPTRRFPSDLHSSDLEQPREAIKYVRTLKGHDDVGVEEFIKSVKRAKADCARPERLLDLVINEKIIDDAERNIRGIEIHNYKDLFQALRDNVSAATSYELARSKLMSTRQLNENIRSYDKRFLERYNELRYAIQNEADEDTSPTETRVLLKMEERNVIKTYIGGLRDEICMHVRSTQPRTLRDARMEALETETFLLERKRSTQPTRVPMNPTPFKNRFEQRPPRPPFTQTNAPLYNAQRNFSKLEAKPLGDRMKLYCDFCKMNGHTSDRCFRKQGFPHSQNLKRPPQRINNIMEHDEIEYSQQEENFGTANGNWEEPTESADTLSTQDPQ